MPTILERVIAVAGRELNVDPPSLKAETDAADIPNWTSSAHLVLMMALEEEFGISFELDEVVELTNLGRISMTVEAKAAAGSG